MEETLEIEPLNNKNLRVILVAREYDEDWKFSYRREKSQLHLFSKHYANFIDHLVDEWMPNFVTIEVGNRLRKDFENDILCKALKFRNIPFFLVGIPGEAESDIESQITQKVETLQKINLELTRIWEEMPEQIEEDKNQSLIAIGQYLEEEINEYENYIGGEFNNAWIVKGILNHAACVAQTNITVMHIAAKGYEHLEGLEVLMAGLDIKTEQIQFAREVDFPKRDETELSAILQSALMPIKPIIVKEKKKNSRNSILYLFTTDDLVSPFDINMAVDAGFDMVLSYSSVNPEKARLLTQDIIFSRGAEGAKYTTVFVSGGRDLKEVNSVVDSIKSTMFPPFVVSLIVDPRGAYSTAAALVAKVKEAFESLNIGTLNGKQAAILGGTTPVGRISGLFLAKMGVDVIIVETDPSSTQEITSRLVNEIANEYSVKFTPIHAFRDEDLIHTLKDVDIILSTVKAGVQVVSKEILSQISPGKVLVDVNAVPPAGIEELKPRHDKKEIMEGIYGIGALIISDLKYKVEKEMLKSARITPMSELDKISAFEIAESLIVQQKGAKCEPIKVE